MPTATPTRNGFTLVELLVVVGIILILAALASVAIKRSLRIASSTANLNQIRQSTGTIISAAAESGRWPRAWSNQDFFPGAQDTFYSIPSISEVFVTSDPLKSPLVSPSVKMRENPPRGYDQPITHFSLSMGPANLHPYFNPALSFVAVQNPVELILLTDGGDNGDTPYGTAQAHNWQLNEFSAKGKANDPVPLREKYGDQLTGRAKIDFTRHGGERAHVSFCDGHVELRHIDSFKFRNFLAPGKGTR